MPVSGVDYMGAPTGQTHGPVGLKWDPKNLEIRTTSVERTLEPLVIQVLLKAVFINVKHGILWALLVL